MHGSESGCTPISAALRSPLSVPIAIADGCIESAGDESDWVEPHSAHGRQPDADSPSETSSRPSGIRPADHASGIRPADHASGIRPADSPNKGTVTPPGHPAAAHGGNTSMSIAGPESAAAPGPAPSPSGMSASGLAGSSTPSSVPRERRLSLSRESTGASAAEKSDTLAPTTPLGGATPPPKLNAAEVGAAAQSRAPLLGPNKRLPSASKARSLEPLGSFASGTSLSPGHAEPAAARHGPSPATAAPGGITSPAAASGGVAASSIVTVDQRGMVTPLATSLQTGSTASAMGSASSVAGSASSVAGSAGSPVGSETLAAAAKGWALLRAPSLVEDGEEEDEDEMANECADRADAGGIALSEEEKEARRARRAVRRAAAARWAAAEMAAAKKAAEKPELTEEEKVAEKTARQAARVVRAVIEARQQKQKASITGLYGAAVRHCTE